MGNYEPASYQSVEENERLIRQSELRALVSEKQGYESRIAIADASGDKETATELRGALADVTAVLAGAGAASTPVSRTRK